MNLLQFISVVSILHRFNLEKNLHIFKMHLELPGIHSLGHTLLHQYSHIPLSIHFCQFIHHYSTYKLHHLIRIHHPTGPELPDEWDSLSAGFLAFPTTPGISKTASRSKFSKSLCSLLGGAGLQAGPALQHRGQLRPPAALSPVGVT